MERGRCEKHGLVVGKDGCLRCRREAQRRANRRGLALLVGVAVAGACAIASARFALDARANAPHVVASAAERPVATPMPTPSVTAKPPMALPTTTVRATTPPTIVATDVAAYDQRVQTAMRSVSVTIYTTQYCPWCKRAKAFLDQRGVAYTERPVDLDSSARATQQRIAGTTSVPVVDIEGNVTVGYNPTWMEQTLRARAQQRL